MSLNKNLKNLKSSLQHQKLKTATSRKHRENSLCATRIYNSCALCHSTIQHELYAIVFNFPFSVSFRRLHRLMVVRCCCGPTCLGVRGNPLSSRCSPVLPALLPQLPYEWALLSARLMSISNNRKAHAVTHAPESWL